MHKQQRWMGVGLALAATLGLSMTTAVLAAADASNPLAVDWAPYADGLTEPLDIAFTGVATDTRMFVVERGGLIKVVLDNGTVLTTPFLDIDHLTSDEAFADIGLLGLVFDPDYANNGHFYVYYTTNITPNLQLSRFQVSADPNVALTTEVELLTIPRPLHSHSGGDLNFGPDGYLYVAPGDGYEYGNPQALDSLLGKMLRLDVSGQTTYTVPVTNPFTQTVGARPEIWAYGFRNPWRFSFDQLTGDLYIADVGELQWEEINFQPAGSAGGENYGWPCFEATHAFFTTTYGCPLAEAPTMPVVEYSHSEGVAVMGGFVYRGAAYPALNGLYFFADYGTHSFWALNTSTQVVTALGQMIALGVNPSTFGQDATGELYVADISGGAIYKLTGPLPRVYLPLLFR